MRTAPSRLSVIRTLLVAALVALGVSVGTTAHAICDDSGSAPEPELGEQIDAAFGDWLVTPLATVMFFDVVFWDDTLPVGAMPDQPDVAALSAEEREAWTAEQLQLRGPELVGYDEAKGYVYRCRAPARVREIRPVLAEGATLKRGVLELELSTNAEGALVGSWGEVPVDLEGLGLALDPEQDGPGTVTDAPTDAPSEERVLKQVSLETLAPFPVVVDLTAGLIRPGQVELDWSEVPVIAGSRVRLGDAELEVAAIEGHRASLRTLTPEFDPGQLPNPGNISLPLVVLWLVLGAVFFTFRFGFVNVRAFWHAILVTSGRYDDEDDPGEVSHFQALSSALSATVGLGNIAGVAIAVSVGGPGAVVWMVIAALFGMSSKFTEVTLGQMYRVVRSDGTVSGGPMHYLSKGLKERKLGGLGMVLAVIFSVMAIGGSLGGGNMFQGNQSFQAIADVAPLLQPASAGSVSFARLAGERGVIEIPESTAVAVPGGAVFKTEEAVTLAEGTDQLAVNVVAVRGGYDGNVPAGAISQVAGAADRLGRVTPNGLDDQVTVSNATPTEGGASYGLFYGFGLTIIVGLVIIGGIKRIGATAGVIVPVMGVIYVLAGVYIIVMQGVTSPGAVASAFGTLFSSAFDVQAGIGGLIGVLVTGFQRASFSNEAGVGSASIAHSAAATDEPVREGVVALLEPFIDTVVVCTVTGLVVVVTGAYTISGVDGISMTTAAFEGGGLPGARYILAAAVTLFAFSTMISWSYYGERAATWMLGDWASLPYKALFLLCVLLGPVFTLGNVIGFSDLMVLGMAFPNILGLYLLSGKVGRALKEYMGKVRSGAFEDALGK